MKILAVSDVESSLFWDFFQSSYLEDIDLILSAGDLNANYLSFLVTMGHAPVLYVPGNHDGNYGVKPPEGCVNIDRKLYVYNGIRILGLGGCMQYNRGPNQYTDLKMTLDAMRLTPGILLHRGFDILLTHAPARDFHDAADPAHRGFGVFNTLIDSWHPAYHIHGHIHRSYSRDFVRVDRRGDTQVINACEKYVFDF